MRHLFAVILLALCAVAHADTKVRFWSGFPPGGATDMHIRTLQQCINTTVPSLVTTVEYRPGAAGVIGFKQFVSNQPQEYVELLLDSSSMLINTLITKTNDLNPETSVQILLPVGHVQEIIMASPKLGITDIAGLKALNKSRIAYGSAGIGSMSHITTAFVEDHAAHEFVHIPYKGPVIAVPDLATGTIDLLSDYISSGITAVRAGNAVAIGVTGPSRSALLPDVKTLAEQGIRDFPIDPWAAVFSHPANDAAKTATVGNYLKKCLDDPTVQQSYKDKGVQVMSAADRANPQSWYQRQIARYKALAKLPKMQNLN